MPIQISISNAVGARSATATGGIDPDAQAFITAAAITDPTQQAAINTLVLALKGYSIWTKFNAIYPFVGGTASQHKFNLKNPLDTNAAFRLSFLGGWTHSSTGAKPNGTNAYADTFYTPSSHLTDINSNHISYYSRTNAQGGIEMGGGPVPLVDLSLRYGVSGGTLWNMAVNANLAATLDSRYFLINTRTASNLFKFIKNGTVVTTSTGAAGTTKPNVSYYLGKRNYPDGIYSTLECAFASIGDGLTDAESLNFYTAVQAFQTTLGRSIGTQTVSDADAQAFVTAANIQDQVEANAINNLVIGMKADGLWTKMKAVYPFVGGTASTHKWNLKNPLDTDAAFRLTFSGGWTHSSTGATPNGTNGYANAFVNVGTNLAQNSTHVSVYSRTNVDRVAPSIGNVTGGAPDEVSMWIRSGGLSYLRVNNQTASTTANTDSRGLFIGNRVNSTQMTLSIRGTQTTFSNTSNSTSTTSIKLGSIPPNFFDTKELAFASVGDGLTSQNMTDLTTAVQAYQTTLGRQV